MKMAIKNIFGLSVVLEGQKQQKSEFLKLIILIFNVVVFLKDGPIFDLQL